MFKTIIPLVMFALTALSAEVRVLGIPSSITWLTSGDVRIASWSTSDTALKTVIHYKMNDNAANTTIVDSGTLGANATSTGNTAPYSATGKINSCLIMANVAHVPMPTLPTNGALCMWVKGGTGGILRAIKNGPLRLFDFYYQSGRYYIGWYNVGTGPDQRVRPLASEIGVNTADWNHFVLNWTVGGNIQLFVNGSPIAAYYTISPFITYWDTSLAEAFDFGATSAYIDDVRTYNSALLPAEIEELYNNGNGTEAELTYQR